MDSRTFLSISLWRASTLHCAEARRLIKTLRDKNGASEAEFLEQRLGLIEICKFLSTAEDLTDLSDEDLCKYVYQVQSRDLCLSFEVKLALAARAAKTALEKFLSILQLQDRSDEDSWTAFASAFGLSWSSTDQKFDGLAPRIALLVKEAVELVETEDFLGPQKSEGATDPHEALKQQCQAGMSTGTLHST